MLSSFFSSPSCKVYAQLHGTLCRAGAFQIEYEYYTALIANIFMTKRARTLLFTILLTRDHLLHLLLQVFGIFETLYEPTKMLSPIFASTNKSTYFHLFRLLESHNQNSLSLDSFSLPYYHCAVNLSTVQRRALQALIFSLVLPWKLQISFAFHSFIHLWTVLSRVKHYTRSSNEIHLHSHTLSSETPEAIPFIWPWFYTF